jgi:hypothetical protein
MKCASDLGSSCEVMVVGSFPAEAQRRSNGRDSQNRETGMEMHGSFFYRDEGDKMGGTTETLVLRPT